MFRLIDNDSTAQWRRETMTTNKQGHPKLISHLDVDLLQKYIITLSFLDWVHFFELLWTGFKTEDVTYILQLAMTFTPPPISMKLFYLWHGRGGSGAALLPSEARPTWSELPGDKGQAAWRSSSAACNWWFPEWCCPLWSQLEARKKKKKWCWMPSLISGSWARESCSFQAFKWFIWTQRASTTFKTGTYVLLSSRHCI